MAVLHPSVIDGDSPRAALDLGLHFTSPCPAELRWWHCQDCLGDSMQESDLVAGMQVVGRSALAIPWKRGIVLIAVRHPPGSGTLLLLLGPVTELAQRAGASRTLAWAQPKSLCCE